MKISKLKPVFFIISCFLLITCKTDSKNGSQISQTGIDNAKAYARFVPERKDDFAWENDHIAYRMYGPALEADGEISNGIDVWVKSTRALILDKWYKGEDYHNDHGEGLDFYKVGTSLGCGGSALLENGILNKSKNFVNWKIIENGPERVRFRLSYAPRKYKGTEISEIKNISLKAGENLNEIKVIYNTGTTHKTIFQSVIGIVKHSGIDSAQTIIDRENGLFAYREPANPKHGSIMVGVIIDPDLIASIKETKIHYLIELKETTRNTFNYYAGAAWTKGLDFTDFNQWIKYLKNFNQNLKKK